MLPAERLLFGIAANIDRSRHLNTTGGSGHEIALMIFIFAIAVLVLILLRLIALTGLSPKIFGFAGGIVALAFVPTLWLHANQVLGGGAAVPEVHRHRSPY